MAVKVYAAARERLLEIWDYTERRWGEEKADRYVRGLIKELERARDNRHRWRPVPDDNFEGVFFIRYKSHFLFFRLLSDESLGVISILHGQMDIPSRLREDVERDDAMEG